jgi:membrane protein DedA with SNARE-associated domain
MTQALAFSPSAIWQWVPFAKAASFFLATFVLEDVAAVGAGLLLGAGGISWPAAFVACFLGIWMGDAGLYALARYAGREWFERSSFRRFAAKVAESERWFAERGTPILIFSRLIPGARLPTYLAAGFLRLPLARFLFVTGAASFAWTLAVLSLAQRLGVRLTHLLSAYKHGGLMLLTFGIGLFVLLQAIRRAMRGLDFLHTPLAVGCVGNSGLRGSSIRPLRRIACGWPSNIEGWVCRQQPTRAFSRAG